MKPVAVSGLPAFTFPLVGWAPELATGEPDDDGTLGLLTSRGLTVVYFPETDLSDWILVDAEGHSWEVVSSQITGRADGWWGKILPKWFWHPRYRLVLEFAERPPVSFDAVKSRLFAAVKANPRAYPYGQSRERRAELREAKSLYDLIKSQEALAIERLRPSAWWSQWLSGEGRCSRLEFIPTVALIVTALGVDVAKQIPMPWFLVIVLVCLGVAISAVIRRLHDLRQSGWWIAAWLLFTFLCALIHGPGWEVRVKAAASVWQIGTLCAVGFLAIAPGTAGPNRYGFAPRLWPRS